MGILKTVKFLALSKLLKAHGFTLERQRGSHIIYDRKDLKRPLVIPVHGKEVKFCCVMQIVNIMKMTPQDFVKELKKF